MADLKRWFKVWTTILDDPHFQELTLEQIGQWTLLGAMTASVGKGGRLMVPGAARRLCEVLRVATPEALKSVIKALPNVLFEEGKNRDAAGVVTWKYWHKYQRDSKAAERMKALRSKRRREEKRGEEKRVTSPVGDEAAASPGGRNGFADWPPEWEAIKARIQTLPFLDRYQAWLTDLDWWKTQDEKFEAVPATLDHLLCGAVAYITSTRYKPRTRVGLLKKLHNCLEVEARKAERETKTREG